MLARESVTEHHKATTLAFPEIVTQSTIALTTGSYVVGTHTCQSMHLVRVNGATTCKDRLVLVVQMTGLPSRDTCLWANISK